VVVDVGELRLADLHGYVERTFRHVAEAKGVGFEMRFDAHLPAAMMTDSKRLQQVIKNLLSNAFKFTQQGQVSLTVSQASEGWSLDNDELNRSSTVLAFSVSDTGIGIAPDKQQIIFEAFQQADGSTSRKYGGTGLGLAISREISRLLGGEIRLTSAPGKGSTFTLYLPLTHAPAKPPRRVVVPEPTTNGKANGVATPATRDAEPIAETTRLINEVGDDRDSIQPGDHVLLVVENDLTFARLLGACLSA
jgi:signal transduction histidine kinase